MNAPFRCSIVNVCLAGLVGFGLSQSARAQVWGAPGSEGLTQPKRSALSVSHEGSGIGANFTTDSADRAAGMHVGLSIGKRIYSSEDWSVSASFGVSFADKTFASRSSGLGANYASGASRPDLGLNVRDAGLGIGVAYRISKDWTASGRFGASRLLGDGTESLNTRQLVQPSLSIGVGYRY